MTDGGPCSLDLGLGKIKSMKTKDFYQLIQPLSEKLYRTAYNLLPDDLQAEQLVIDALNAYLIKERSSILRKDVDLRSKRDTLTQRRQTFKGILGTMTVIGLRRATQLSEQLKLQAPIEFRSFFDVEPKGRLILTLRYDQQFTVDEISDIVGAPRFEVIEKLHNGRFLLLNTSAEGVRV